MDNEVSDLERYQVAERLTLAFNFWDMSLEELEAFNNDAFVETLDRCLFGDEVPDRSYNDTVNRLVELIAPAPVGTLELPKIGGSK